MSNFLKALIFKLISKFFHIELISIRQALSNMIVYTSLFFMSAVSVFFVSSFVVYSVGVVAEETEEVEDDDSNKEVDEQAQQLPVSEAKDFAFEEGYKWKDDRGCGNNTRRIMTLEEWKDACLEPDDDNSCTEETEESDCKGGEVCVDGECVSADEVEPTGAGPCDPSALLLGGVAAAQTAECCRTGMACEIRIQRAVDDAKEVCSEFREKAFSCCYQPTACLPGGEVTGQIANVAGMVNSASGGSMSETCKKLKQSFAGFSSINAFMATSCRSKARRCSSKCNEALNDIDDVFQDACGVSLDTSRGWKNSFKCDSNVYEEYQYAYEKLEDVPDECKEVSKESNRQTAQVAIQLAGLLTTAKACKLKLADDEPPAPTPCTFGCPSCMECVEGMCKSKKCGPCQVCMAGDGKCRSICIAGQTCGDSGQCEFTSDTGSTGSTDSSDPEVNSGNPLLGGINAGAGGGGSLTDESGMGRELGSEFGSTGDGPFQESDFDLTDSGLPVKSGQAGSVGGLLGGSGGGGGGGGLGGGAGGGSGGGGGGDGGYGGGDGDAASNDILQGFESGKFSGYGGKGGHKGYGKAPRDGRGKKGRGKKKRKQAKLDLKNLMPKDKKLDKARRKFGSIHDNIFQRISNRVQVLCRTDKIRCRK